MYDLRALLLIPTKLLRSLQRLMHAWKNGSPDIEINGLNGIELAGAGELTFVSNPKYAAAARSTKAAAVIVSEDCDLRGDASRRSLSDVCAGARTFSCACAVCAGSASDSGGFNGQIGADAH